MTRAFPPTLIAVALLAAWLGAATVFAAVVAPAAFDVLPSRTLAGALVGRVLPVLFWSGVVVGVATAWLGARLPQSPSRMAAAVVIVVSCLVAQLFIAPRIERL